jgi:acyl-coenzyme A thioesterase PaaI-like protein
LADCVSGYRAVRDFDGAWLGTSELAVHGPFREADDPVVARAELLRRRKSGAVYEVTMVSGPDAELLAEATVTMALLSRQGERKLPRVDGPFPRPVEEPLESLGDLVDLDEGGTGAGETRLTVTDAVRNSWGVVAGGIVTLLTEVEAERRAGMATGSPCRVDGLGMHFLAPGRSGPIIARATLLGDGWGDGSSHLRVRVHDAGDGDRLIAAASATARPIALREVAHPDTVEAAG